MRKKLYAFFVFVLYLLLRALAHTVLPARNYYREPGKVYMRRHTLVPHWVAKWFGKDAVFVHHFRTSDGPHLDLHNHPYGTEEEYSWSLILRFGYVEERLLLGPFTDRRVYLAGMVNRIWHDTYHRVDLLDEVRGCWTLFVPAKKHPNGWGFYNLEHDAFTHWSGHDHEDVYPGYAGPN